MADKLLVTTGAVGLQVKAFVTNVDRHTSVGDVGDVGDVGGGSNLSSNKALSSSNISNIISTTNSTIGNNTSTVGIEAVSTGIDEVMVQPVTSSNSISSSTSEQPRLNAPNWGSLYYHIRVIIT